MASIGGVSCDFVHGGPPPGLETVLQEWRVSGINGRGAQDMGEDADRGAYQVVKHDSEANVLTWIGNVQALQGTLVSVVDDWGQTWTNFLVLRVGRPRMTPAQGNGYTTRGEISVTGRVVA